MKREAPLKSRVLAVLLACACIPGGPAGAQAPAAPAGPAKAAAPAAAPARPTAAAPPAESRYPLVLKSGTTTLTIYQPQIDDFSGYAMTARAAVGATTADGKTTYGIIHVKAQALVDKGARSVTLDQYKVEKADFPAAEARKAEWVAAIQKEASTRRKVLSLDRLEAAMAAFDAERTSAGGALKNDPPTIVFSSVPAMLVYVDGQPAYRPVAGTSLERVINTRPLLLKDAQGHHYLHVFDGWMSGPGASGPFTREANPPADLAKAKKAAIEGRQVDLLTGQTSPDDKAPSLAKGPVPAIVVASAPTELIVIDGDPKWVPIQGTQLMYVENTTGHIFNEVTDQRTYVLVSGRWFSCPDMKGPWEFVPADKLPKDFPAIPDESPKENVKAAIAGTPQAREAAIAAEIPQTSVVTKAEAKMTPPKFDGEPQLKAIEGTSLQYVANTATPILMVDAKSWYALENGIWFVSTSVKGPWYVATSVPAAIYSIPFSSPLHYVTYVKIYDTTATTVVVGYTPGYQGTYVDPVTSVVVYGSGYPYTPWVGTAWYGPPVTYGFGAAMCYTPYTGWAYGYGFGWAWGAATIAIGWGWGAYPWWGSYGWGYGWGPPYYGSPYGWGGAAYGWRGGAAAWGPGGWAGTTGNIYSQWGARSGVHRTSGGYNAWTGNRWASQVGSSYNSRTGVATAGQRGAVRNVYTGNYAAGARGAAVGPGGTVAVGSRGTAGNVYTGNQVSGGRGTVYNPRTGEGTNVAGARGEHGGVARVGDDVYAGRDGNVYRRTDGGWQQNSGGEWRSSGGDTRDLDRQSSARSSGSQRATTTRSSWQGMSHSRGGGGYRGGGGRRR